MSRFLVALAGASALTAVPAVAQDAGPDRARTFVQPYLEVTQQLDADLETGDVLTYTTLSAGVDAGVQTRRAEAQISYRYDRRIPWGDDLLDSDVHTGLARGSLLLAPGLSVEGGAIATRARSDIRGSAPLTQVGNLENTTEVYSLYAGPTFSHRFGAAQFDAGYRIGYTRAEAPDSLGLIAGSGRRDYFDEATNHLATARLGVEANTVLPVGLSLSGAYEREDAGQLDQYYEGWFGRGDVLLPVSPTLALTAGVGYERIETGARDPLVTALGTVAVDGDGRFVADPASPVRVNYRTDGVFYDAGVVWRPNRRTELTARVGERYGSVSATGTLTYQASRDVGLAVQVYDGIQTFGRQLRTGLANLPTSFVQTRDQFVQQFNGCIFGTSGKTPGGCLNDVFQSLTTASYRARGIDAIVSATRGRNQFGVGAGYANRRIHNGTLPAGIQLFGVEDESWYGQAFFSRTLTAESSFDTQAFLNYYESKVPGDGGVLSAGAVASYYRSFGRLSTTASVGLYRFEVGDFGDEWSAQALLGARYTF